ncbi:hypothetical protein, partial [Pseudomonas aeruginosa]|uniref:hypothetical protein n=1 Tax=Pseudomonas aeruginosa TaxID=287 RepID=UPI0031B6A7EC
HYRPLIFPPKKQQRTARKKTQRPEEHPALYTLRLALYFLEKYSNSRKSTDTLTVQAIAAPTMEECRTRKYNKARYGSTSKICKIAVNLELPSA